MLKTKSKIVLILIIILTILTILSLTNSSSQPTHRTDIYHPDPVGDVSDPDIDIIQLGSYEEEGNIVLSLTVDGSIQYKGNPNDQNDGSYRYEFRIVARNENDQDLFIYTIIYTEGQVQNYNIDSRNSIDTLRIYFNKDIFHSNTYMIGLEATAYSPAIYKAEMDITSADRDRPISFS